MNFIFFSLGMISLQLVYVLMNFILFRKMEFIYLLMSVLSMITFFVLKIFPNLNPFLLIS